MRRRIQDSNAALTFGLLVLGGLLAVGCEISTSSDGGLPDGQASTGCASSADCNDGVDCTTDTCGASGTCRHVITPALCGSGESCDAVRGCEPGAPCATSADCADMDPCTTNERCDPAARTCAHDTLDGDHDGDPPRVCAGGHDCDDSNPDVYSGADERCNAIDDDCDGAIDEAPAVTTSCGMGPLACTDGRCVCTAAIATDPMNCGGCGIVCAGGATCTGGACTCAAGLTYCAGTGCTTTDSDPINCGACGHFCSGGCAAGSCCAGSDAEICNGLDDDCDGVADNGFACARGAMVSCAINCAGFPQTGTTMTPCQDDCTIPAVCPGAWDGFAGEIGGGSICGGTCCADGCSACHDGWDGDCDGLVDCADPDCRGDLVADPACCGTPGLACCSISGSEFCAAGVCASGVCTCASGTTACGTTCVNTTTDASNCGACGHACATGGMCSSGACMCAGADGRVCGGVCTDVAVDEANCGACGAPCGATQFCVGGSCRDPVEIVVPSDLLTVVANEESSTTSYTTTNWNSLRTATFGIGTSTTWNEVAAWYSPYWSRFRIRRLAVRFPRPTLPTGATVVAAALLVRPSAIVDPTGVGNLRVSSLRPASPPNIGTGDFYYVRWGTEAASVSAFTLAVGTDTRVDLPADAVTTFVSAASSWFVGLRTEPDVSGALAPYGETTRTGPFPEVTFNAASDVRLALQYVP